MGKADNKLVLSPALREAFKKMAEDSAKVGKKLVQLEHPAFKKMAEDSAKFAKKLAEAERASTQNATEVAPKPKPKPKKKRKSYWDDPVDRALRENYGSDAKNFSPKDVVKKVLAALGPEIRTSGRKPPTRSLILRKSGHWKG